MNGKISTILGASVVSGLLAISIQSVYATDPDVARGKPTSASSSYGIYVPSRGNDGDPNSIWNGGGYQACWTVDLLGRFSIKSVVVRSNQFGDSGLKTIFQVASSSDNMGWKPLGQTYTAQGDQTFTIPVGGTSMRYIRYCTSPNSTQWATLSELKAYGSPNKAPRQHTNSAQNSTGNNSTGNNSDVVIPGRASAGVSMSCDPKQGRIVVPDGRRASSFAFEFKPGVGCGSGGSIDSGFDISTGNCSGYGNVEKANIYSYWRASNGASTHSNPSISQLTLGSGVYCLSFNGGRGGYVKLTYIIR